MEPNPQGKAPGELTLPGAQPLLHTRVPHGVWVLEGPAGPPAGASSRAEMFERQVPAERRGPPGTRDTQGSGGGREPGAGQRGACRGQGRHVAPSGHGEAGVPWVHPPCWCEGPSWTHQARAGRGAERLGRAEARGILQRRPRTRKPAAGAGRLPLRNTQALGQTEPTCPPTLEAKRQSIRY